jgi:hypothetical protein
MGTRRAMMLIFWRGTKAGWSTEGAATALVVPLAGLATGGSAGVGGSSREAKRRSNRRNYDAWWNMLT